MLAPLPPARFALGELRRRSAIEPMIGHMKIDGHHLKGRAGDAANAMPARPIIGAGLPGLVMACGRFLGLARRRRQKIA